jgi:GNAT superfamily N-acetyltransferase
MTNVEEATPEMFEEVYGLLQQFNRNNPQITRHHWELLFQQPWRKPGDPIGYVLRADGKIVGYLGVIWSHRNIDGKLEDCCNLTSWVVSPEHRQRGIALFMPVVKFQNCTVTIHTPAQHVHEFYKRMGFRELETKLKVLYPVPQWKGLFRGPGFRGTTNPRKIEKILRGTDADIFRDHRAFHCRHLVIYNKQDYCYVIFTRTKGRKVHFSDIHYISHPAIFLENLNRIKFHLFLSNGTLLTLLQSRLVGDADIPHSKISVYKAPTLFKSSRLKPQQVDNLYSELMLLPI